MGNPKTKIGSGEVGRFDQKYTAYCRANWDPSLQAVKPYYSSARVLGDRPGYTLKDWSFAHAAWNLERRFGRSGSLMGNFALTQWEIDREEIERTNRIAPGQKYIVSDPAEMSRDIKKVAKFLGASLVGICKWDQRWIYSYRFSRETFDYAPLNVPPECEYAIVMAHEMDYEVIKTSPAYTSAAGPAKGYSDIAYVVGLLAHFIRGLGYKAIPCGNDTALSIPLAIDAGLGELGRNGLLITERFGPRVRISKVFTDLPLVPDQPVEFGVRDFCDSCKRCAEECPGRAISFGEPTYEGPTISNNNGAYKWYINPEKCPTFWAQTGAPCSNCIRVCPFNKSKGWLHDSAKFLARNAPWLDPLLLRLDKLFGYGEMAKPEEFWR